MSTDLPGGDDFVDVTAIFENASRDMDPEDVLLVDGFSLYDAMTALEIGDPRMDTGVVLEEQRRPPFEPLSPLLPEELCYILDRAVACEMQWHSGYTLSQTVYTFLHVHHIRDLDPEMVAADAPKYHDPVRPIQLVTIVLQGYLTAYLKCCNLVWRELSKGRVHDTEDCQLEKSDVSLGESIPLGLAIARLENAIAWVEEHLSRDKHSMKEPLLDRLRLRQTLLDLFRVDPSRLRPDLRVLVARARSTLDRIRHGAQPPTPPNHSPASLAFDPYVTRRLSTTMPLHPLALPSQEKTWDTLSLLLDGLDQLHLLSMEARLSSWKTAANLRASIRLPHLPFSRSLIQIAFYNGASFLAQHPLTWVVDQFFAESLGLPYIPSTWNIPQIADVQQRILQLVSKDIQCGWYNRPRRRRHLVSSLVEWSGLYIRLQQCTEAALTEEQDQNDLAFLHNLPKVPLLWRLDALREIIFSGFKLELYAAHEKAFAYWYLRRILSDHINILDDLDSVIPPGSITRQDVSVTRSFLSALQAMCGGMFVMTIPLITVSADRMYLNFTKRFKWAFNPRYAKFPEHVPTMPHYDDFVDACEANLNDLTFSPADCFERALDLLAQLTNSTAGSAHASHEERSEFFASLSDTAAQLAVVLPRSVKDVPNFDQKLFDWNAAEHRWFPGVRAS